MNQFPGNTDNKESSEGVGRISKQDSEKATSETSLQEKRDISHIDQQEGEMNHGSVGGNFQESLDEAKNG